MEDTAGIGDTEDDMAMPPRAITLDTLPNEIQQIIYWHALRAKGRLTRRSSSAQHTGSRTEQHSQNIEEVRWH